MSAEGRQQVQARIKEARVPSQDLTPRMAQLRRGVPAADSVPVVDSLRQLGAGLYVSAAQIYALSSFPGYSDVEGAEPYDRNIYVAVENGTKSFMRMVLSELKSSEDQGIDTSALGVNVKTVGLPYFGDMVVMEFTDPAHPENDPVILTRYAGSDVKFDDPYECGMNLDNQTRQWLASKRASFEELSYPMQVVVYDYAQVMEGDVVETTDWLDNAYIHLLDRQQELGIVEESSETEPEAPVELQVFGEDLQTGIQLPTSAQEAGEVVSETASLGTQHVAQPSTESAVTLPVPTEPPAAKETLKPERPPVLTDDQFQEVVSKAVEGVPAQQVKLAEIEHMIRVFGRDTDSINLQGNLFQDRKRHMTNFSSIGVFQTPDSLPENGARVTASKNSNRVQVVVNAERVQLFFNDKQRKIQVRGLTVPDNDLLVKAFARFTGLPEQKVQIVLSAINSLRFNPQQAGMPRRGVESPAEPVRAQAKEQPAIPAGVVKLVTAQPNFYFNQLRKRIEQTPQQAALLAEMRKLRTGDLSVAGIQANLLPALRSVVLIASDMIHKYSKDTSATLIGSAVRKEANSGVSAAGPIITERVPQQFTQLVVDYLQDAGVRVEVEDTRQYVSIADQLMREWARRYQPDVLARNKERIVASVQMLEGEQRTNADTILWAVDNQPDVFRQLQTSQEVKITRDGQDITVGKRDIDTLLDRSIISEDRLLRIVLENLTTDVLRLPLSEQIHFQNAYLLFTASELLDILSVMEGKKGKAGKKGTVAEEAYLDRFQRAIDAKEAARHSGN